MSFVARTPVRFAHVDPAGIVFYPRYFEMLNGAVEDWFASMGFDFRHLHQTLGLGAPTVRLEVDFKAPSRLGDALDFTLSVDRASARSCTLRVRMRCGSRRWWCWCAWIWHRRCRCPGRRRYRRRWPGTRGRRIGQQQIRQWRQPAEAAMSPPPPPHGCGRPLWRRWRAPGWWGGNRAAMCQAGCR